ncbi:hypothetical protein ABZ636_06990 [Streptomyces sp. NPDC007251]|uniref:hypothetical protein n=1 Tax=Streptomyces sp. NPDC007251 TaxID=3154483 RepID=UPI0033E1C310
MLAKSVRVAAAAAACAAIATAAYATTHNGQGNGRTTAQSVGGHPQTEVAQRLAQPHRVPRNGLVKGMRLPVEDYMLSNADTAQVEDARSAVESSCMQREGFTFNPPSARDTVPAGYDEANMERRYGLIDDAVARTHGYQLPGAADPSQEQAESDAEEKAENRTDAWDKALDEVCIPEANKKIGIINPTDPAGELSAQSLEATKTQAPVAKALAAWSSCMNRAGYSLRSPPRRPRRLPARCRRPYRNQALTGRGEDRHSGRHLQEEQPSRGGLVQGGSRLPDEADRRPQGTAPSAEGPQHQAGRQRSCRSRHVRQPVTAFHPL